ncbi:MAG TPA: alanyl-tRNA editing protein [Thermoplasmata archaeon]|nr:alanyl-tRNA editing protein [Thermoplasmata archaeon]
MTELAYLADEDAAYTREFVAKVVALPPGAVVLDRTFFYPTGGGQPADHGTLTPRVGPLYTVVDVTRSGTSALHRIRRPAGGGAPSLQVGDEVEGTLDWERRHRHMRLHTGQHLLSALIFERTGVRTREATMSGSGGTVDLERPLPEETSPEALTAEANAILREGRRVSIRYLSRGEWERNPTPRSGLVPLPRQVDPVRIIEVAGLDACPCGGTHVRSTAEVGELALDAPVPIALGAVRVPFRLVDASRSTRPG